MSAGPGASCVRRPAGTARVSAASGVLASPSPECRPAVPSPPPARPAPARTGPAAGHRDSPSNPTCTAPRPTHPVPPRIPSQARPLPRAPTIRHGITPPRSPPCRTSRPAFAPRPDRGAPVLGTIGVQDDATPPRPGRSAHPSAPFRPICSVHIGRDLHPQPVAASRPGTAPPPAPRSPLPHPDDAALTLRALRAALPPTSSRAANEPRQRTPIPPRPRPLAGSTLVHLRRVALMSALESATRRKRTHLVDLGGHRTSPLSRRRRGKLQGCWPSGDFVCMNASVTRPDPALGHTVEAIRAAMVGLLAEHNTL